MGQIAFTRQYKVYAPFMVYSEVEYPGYYQGCFGKATHKVMKDGEVLATYDYWPNARDDAKRRFENGRIATPELAVWLLVQELRCYSELHYEIIGVYGTEEGAIRAKQNLDDGQEHLTKKYEHIVTKHWVKK